MSGPRPGARSWAVWGRMINIGLPAGGEFGFMFLYMAVIYWVIRDFGARGPGGFRPRHPAHAVDLPAGDGDRVRDRADRGAELRRAAVRPRARNFRERGEGQHRAHDRADARARNGGRNGWSPSSRTEPDVVEVGSHFLRIASFNFVASGLIFTCSGIFQGLGHTWPALAATASRIVTFMLPAIWLSTLPGYRIEQVWYLSVASVWMQAAISFVLLRRTMKARLR